MRKTVQIQDVLRKEFHNHTFTPDQVKKFETFIELMIKWNKKFNLTAIRNYNEIIVKHLLDSLALLKNSNIKLSGKVIDMGTGAGLPGTILAITHPDITVTSIEKVGKKVIFQDMVKGQLKLDNFSPVNSRLEELEEKIEFKQNFDIVIARAFDQIDGLFGYAKHFLNPNGKMVFWKGQKWQEELEQVNPKIQNEWELSKKEEYSFQTEKWGGTILEFKQKNN